MKGRGRSRLANISFDYEITECDAVPGADDGTFELIDIDTCIQGDLRLRLDDMEELFDRISLLMVSSGLVDLMWKAVMFDGPDQSRRLVIPDHDPVLVVTVLNDDAFRVSVSIGPQVLAQAECGIMAFVRAVGRFHEAMVGRLLDRNPSLMDQWFLSIPDPAAAVLQERSGRRPRLEVLD